MLASKESLEQIIVASPGLRADPLALGTLTVKHTAARGFDSVRLSSARRDVSGVLQNKDLFVQFTDPKMLDR